MRPPQEPSLAARAVPAFYLHFIYCGMQFAAVAYELNMQIAIIPEENEKSEPFSNRKQVRIFLVWWARVDFTRAAHLKKPRRGFFTRRTVRRVDAVRIHPCIPFCKADKTETPVPGSDTGVLGGRGWIRTTEAESSRFTVCPHWPLGNTPIFIFPQPRGLPVYVTTESAVCQPIIWAEGKKYIQQSQKPSRPGVLYSVRAGGLFSLTKTGQEKITSGSSCRCGAADRRCTAGSARPGSADGRSPRSPRSSGCGCCSSSSEGPSFPSWRPR